MTPEQFCYWLQGFGELGGTPPTPDQWKSINEHLALVFHKVTPPVQPMVPSPLEYDPRRGGYASPARFPLPIVTC
jgi:hypothetical protein